MLKRRRGNPATEQREDEDSLMAMDDGYLELDGAKDEDDIDDDGIAQHKLHIFVAQGLITGTYAAKLSAS